MKYQLKQNGIIVVEVEGSEEQALKEINHYALIYSQDGEVEIIKKEELTQKINSEVKG